MRVHLNFDDNFAVGVCWGVRGADLAESFQCVLFVTWESYMTPRHMVLVLPVYIASLIRVKDQKSEASS
jgi:hypothetical protein